MFQQSKASVSPCQTKLSLLTVTFRDRWRHHTPLPFFIFFRTVLPRNRLVLAAGRHEEENAYEQNNLVETAILLFLCLFTCALFPAVSEAQAPVFVIPQEDSSIKFYVKASVALAGDFEKWDATLTFTSPDVTTGVLDVKIQADSVNTGSGMKDGKLKSKDFFDVEQNPLITFHVKENCANRPRHL